MQDRRGRRLIGAPRVVAVSTLFLLAIVLVQRNQHNSTHGSLALKQRSRVLENFGRAQLGFEPNLGQAAHGVDFITRGGGFEAMLDASGATIATIARDRGATTSRDQQAAQIRMTFAGASPSRAQAEQRLAGVVNYYRGNDPRKWIERVPTYARVRYQRVYPGIDVAYHGDRGSFEFDLYVAPAADPGKIRIGVDGASEVRLDRDGSAVIAMRSGQLALKRPVAYQQIGRARREVSASYRIATRLGKSKRQQVTLALGDYDHSQPLIIDPALVFSTYFGGTVTEIEGATIDSSGNVYVTGFAEDCGGCTPFPTTIGPGTTNNSGDAFVAKISSDGTSLLYSTLIGGTSFDRGLGIAVDAGDNAYVAGQTFSTDFPRTTGPASAPGGGDAFVAKFGTDGAITWATYLGGSKFDAAFSIAVAQGCASNCTPVVAGRTLSSNFTGATGFVGNQDAFVAEMASDGSSTIYSTLIGGNTGNTGAGSGNTAGLSVAVDSAGLAYVVGSTDATDLPKTVGPALAGSTDAFVARLTSSGGIGYERYLGGSDFDSARGVAIGPGCTSPCNAYVEGVTFSKDFPVSAGVVQTTLASAVSMFVSELSSDGSSSVFSTFLGTGDLPTQGALNGIALDSSGDVYLAASTSSRFFPLANAIKGPAAHNGAIFMFSQPTASPTPALTTLNWSAANGSALSIQSGNGTANALYVGSTVGLFTSTDGMNFTQAAATGLPAGPVTVLNVEGKLSPAVIFAGGFNGLYISTDLGNTFVASGLTSQKINSIGDIPGASLSNTKVIAGTLNGVWASTDGGSSFAQVPTIPANTEVFGLDAHGGSPPQPVLAGTSRGVYVSTDAESSFPGTWTLTKLTAPVAVSLRNDPNSSPQVDYAGTYFQGVYESTDLFNTFVNADFPDIVDPTVLSLDRDKSTTPATIYAGVTSLQLGSVFENTTGYNTPFVATNLAGRPGLLGPINATDAATVLESDPVVAELNPTGTSLILSTYLGGSSSDNASAVAVDAAGNNIYLAGTTFSSDFPIAPTAGATPLGPTYQGFSNGFVARIAATAAGPTVTSSPTPTVGATATATPTAVPTPNGAKASFGPLKVNFPVTGIGVSPAMRPFTIKNAGKGGDLIGSISISSPSDAFGINSPGGFDIPAGKSMTETVSFEPNIVGRDSATITVTTNDPKKPTTNVPVAGIGAAGKLVSPKTVNFPATVVGQTVTKSFTIRNVGKGILNGATGQASPNPPFNVENPGSGEIDPKGTVTVKVDFTPTAKGPVTGSMPITVDPPSTGGLSVTLKGTGK